MYSLLHHHKHHQTPPPPPPPPCSTTTLLRARTVCRRRFDARCEGVVVPTGFSRRQRSRLVREIRRESFGISMLRRFRNAALRRPSHAPPADAPEPVMGQLSAWQPEERYRPRQNPALTDVVEAARAAAAKSQNAGALAIEDGSAADAGEQESKGEAPVAGSSRRPPTTGSNRPPTSGSTGSRPQTASEKLLRGQKNRIHVRRMCGRCVCVAGRQGRGSCHSRC